MTIITTWPQSYKLSRPYLGYTRNPLKIGYPFQDESNESKLIYFSSDSHRPDWVRKYINVKKTRLLVKFEENGTFTEIYEILY